MYTNFINYFSDLNIVFCNKDFQTAMSLLVGILSSSRPTIKNTKFDTTVDWFYKRVAGFKYPNLNDGVYILSSVKNLVKNPLPEEFAVICENNNAENYAFLAKLMLPKLVEMKVKPTLPIVNYNFAITSNNFLHQYLSKTHSQLFESGMIQYLRKWSDDYGPISKFYKTLKSFVKTDTSSMIPEHIANIPYSLVLAPKQELKKGETEIFPESKAVSFESVMYPFVVFGFLLVFAMSGFMAEITKHKVAKWENSVVEVNM